MKIFCSAAFLPIVNTAPTMQGKASNNWKTFVLGGEAVSVFREISSKAKSIPLRTQTAETTRWFCVDVHTEMLETTQAASEALIFHRYDSIGQLHLTTSEKCWKNPKQPL